MPVQSHSEANTGYCRQYMEMGGVEAVRRRLIEGVCNGSLGGDYLVDCKLWEYKRV